MSVTVPKGYKQTNIGVVPEEWEVVKLGETINFLDHKRKPIKSSDRQKIQGLYPYYGASGVIDYVNDYLFDEELILLGEDGANIIDRSSRLVFLADGKYWVNNHAHVLKAKNMMNNYFLCEYLESLNYEKYNTGTAQPKLNKDIVSKILICQPPLKEQQKIAKILSTWDKAIEKQEALIVAKEAFKKGLMQRLLSGDWDEVRLGDVASKISDGLHSTPKYEDNTKYFFINGNNLINNQIKITDKTKSVNYEEYIKHRRDLTDRTILMSINGTIGNLALYNNENVILGKSACYINLKKDVDLVYVFLQLSSYTIQSFYISELTGSTIKNLSLKTIKNTKIPLPSLKEQQKIAQILTTSDKEIELLKNELEVLKEQKRGLMQRLLMGEVRVKP